MINTLSITVMNASLLIVSFTLSPPLSPSSPSAFSLKRALLTLTKRKAMQRGAVHKTKLFARTWVILWPFQHALGREEKSNLPHYTIGKFLFLASPLGLLWQHKDLFHSFLLLIQHWQEQCSEASLWKMRESFLSFSLSSSLALSLPFLNQLQLNICIMSVI